MGKRILTGLLVVVVAAVAILFLYGIGYCLDGVNPRG